MGLLARVLVMPLSRSLLGAICLVALLLTGPRMVRAQADREFSIDAEGVESAEVEQAVKGEAERILAQPDYRRMHVQPLPEREPWEWPQMPQWIRDLVNWLGRNLQWLGRIFSFLARWFALLSQTMPIVAWGGLALVVLLIAYLIMRAVAAYQRRWTARSKTSVRPVEEGEAGLNPGDVPADVHVAQALEYARQGLFREAIGCLLLGAMSHAERAAWIRHRRGLTHRDYLRAMRGRELPYTSFRSMVNVYEPICFGRRDAHRTHYEMSLENYQRGFETLEVKR